jgi:hypothetical protein
MEVSQPLLYCSIRSDLFSSQLQDFQNGMDPIKSLAPKDGNDEEDDHDSWEVKK